MPVYLLETRCRSHGLLWRNHNKPVLQEGMLPWLKGREKIKPGEAGRLWWKAQIICHPARKWFGTAPPWGACGLCKLTSRAMQLHPAARHRAVLLTACSSSNIFPLPRKNTTNSPVPPCLMPSLYLLSITKKIISAPRHKMWFVQKYAIKIEVVLLKWLYPERFLFSLKQEPDVSSQTDMCTAPKLARKS